MRVFRGYGWDADAEGWSWTASTKRATWYSWRAMKACEKVKRPYYGMPTVAIADVPRDAVIAYFSGRGDQEVVVAPEDVQARLESPRIMGFDDWDLGVDTPPSLHDAARSREAA